MSPFRLQQALPRRGVGCLWWSSDRGNVPKETLAGGSPSPRLCLEQMVPPPMDAVSPEVLPQPQRRGSVGLGPACLPLTLSCSTVWGRGVWVGPCRPSSPDFPQHLALVWAGS